MLGERRSAGLVDTDRRIQYTKQKDVFPYERLPQKAVKDLYFYGQMPINASNISLEDGSDSSGDSSGDTPTFVPDMIAIKCIANDRKKINKFYLPQFVNAVNKILENSGSVLRIIAECSMGFDYRCKLIRIVDKEDKQKFRVNQNGMLELLEEYQNDSFTARAYSPIAEASLEPSVVDRIVVPYGHYLAFFIAEGKMVDVYPELIEKRVLEIAE